MTHINLFDTTEGASHFLQKLPFHSIFLSHSKIAICQVLKPPPKQDLLTNKNKQNKGTKKKEKSEE